MSLELQIKSVIDRNGNGGSESTIVALHCQQMREWGVRGGNIELRPVQDDRDNTRLKRISKIWKDNQINQRLNHVMDLFICRGEICWLFLPDLKSGGYRIEFFSGGLNHPDPQFKVLYKQGGREIDKVYISYSYEVDTPTGMGSQLRWVKLIIDENWIEQSESSVKPTFNNIQVTGFGDSSGYFSPQLNNDPQKYPNPFAPNLPIIISKNNQMQLGQPGSDDFNWIKTLIETHENLTTKAHKNLRMFSNPIFVTTRRAEEVLRREAGGAQTWAAQNRYVDNVGDFYSGSTNPADVMNFGTSKNASGIISGNSSEGSLDTVIGGAGEGERFGFIQADPVNGDQNLWIKQIRELIHWCLGGVDPLGMSSGATFGEVRTLFGRVENTSSQKANALYENGLCLIFEQILSYEEKQYKEYLFNNLKKYYPKQFKDLTSVEQLTDDTCQGIQQLIIEKTINIPPIPSFAIVPLGDRTINWRFTREVFQTTTREKLDLSIAARNAREDGLSQEWVLRQQYSEMTDQEIRNAMSGFSPRVVQAANGSIASLLQLNNQLMQTPDPSNPKVPWAFSLGIPDLIKQAILTLKKEISYGQPVYEPAAPDVVSFAQVEQSLATAAKPSVPTDRVSNLTPDGKLSSYGTPVSPDPLIFNTANYLRNLPLTNGSDRQTRPDLPLAGGSVSASSLSGDRSPPIPIDPNLFLAYGIDPNQALEIIKKLSQGDN